MLVSQIICIYFVVVVGIVVVVDDDDDVFLIPFVVQCNRFLNLIYLFLFVVVNVFQEIFLAPTLFDKSCEQKPCQAMPSF